MLHRRHNIRSVSTQGVTDPRTICEKFLSHCIWSRDNMTVILVQFKPMARLPAPLPADVVGPANIASISNTGDSAEAKAGTGGTPQAEIKEERPLLSSSST